MNFPNEQLTTQENLNLITDLKFDDVDHKDYPDYCDAYVEEAYYGDRPMTDNELYDLNNNHYDWTHNKLLESIGAEIDFLSNLNYNNNGNEKHLSETQ